MSVKNRKLLLASADHSTNLAYRAFLTVPKNVIDDINYTERRKLSQAQHHAAA